jgi:hypothetical protein
MVMKSFLFFLFTLQVCSADCVEPDTCFLCYPSKSDVQHDDLKGHVRSMTMYESHPKPTPNRLKKNKAYSHVQTFYGQEGQKTERLYCYMGKMAKYVYVYDPYGRLMETLHYDPIGVYKDKSIRVYDAANRMCTETGFNPDSTVAFRSELTYDLRGNWIEYRGYMYTNEIASLRKWEAQYDSTGLQIEMRLFGPDGALSTRTTYQYDENGTLTYKSSQDTSGATLESWRLSYNEKGDLVELLHLRNGTMYENRKITYTYDDHDNWIVQVSVSTYWNTKRRFTTAITREIEYYE